MRFAVRNMSKTLRNWVTTLCNNITKSIYLPTFLPTWIISLLPQDLWLPYLVGRRRKVKSTSSKVTRLFDHLTNEGRYIPTSTKSMAAKIDREVASNGNIWFIKPHNLLITWVHQVTWQKTLYLHFHETCGH